MESTFARPSRAVVSPPSPAGWLGAAVLALAVAKTALLLPSATFQAKAIVAIVEPVSPQSLILPRTAAVIAVSKPVMRRAAESLIGAGIQAPEPGFLERVSLALHLESAKATNKTERLAVELSRLTSAKPDAPPGSLEILATSDNPDRSAQIAGAVAEALVADQRDTIAKTRREDEIEVANHLIRLQSDAAAARRRLAALGGGEADSTQMRTAAAAQTAAAQDRLDTIRAIIASGSPPLSDRRDVPAAIGSFQTSYLDLSRRLAQARETLGDRHTTIISLRAEVKRAAASLTGEWNRLEKLAEGELALAREREASLSSADQPTDENRRAMLEEARRQVQAAADAVTRAQAARAEAPADPPAYRIISRPTATNTPLGLSALTRAILAALAAASMFGLYRCRPDVWLVSLFHRLQRRTSPVGVPVVGGVATDIEPEIAVEVDATPEPKAPVEDTAHLKQHRTVPKVEPEEDLMKAMFELLPELHAISPSFGPLPTIMVAANDTGGDVTRVALALGRAIAASGHRVLLVETDRAEPELAAAASDEDDPVVVDLYGVLRVALRAETKNGLLFLAPSLKHGARIAAALARGTTPLIDEIGEEFDLVVIDGGQVAACSAAGWGADLYLRVGDSESKSEDAQFVKMFDIHPDMLLGTIVASRFCKAPPKDTSLVMRPRASMPRAIPKAANLTAFRPPHPALALRPSVSRRKLGSR